MTTRTCDVAIIGGGPGGSATALSLCAHAPDLSVTLIEASRYQRPRIGESLPPIAGRPLEHLGVRDAFVAQQPLEAHGTAALWGGQMREHDFIFGTRGHGWHVDRRAFDAMLAREARRRGARVMLGTRMTSAVREESGWQLGLSNGNALHAHVVVDATGSAASFAHRAGAKLRRADQLVAYVHFFKCNAPGDHRTQVEAFDSGWWYTAMLPRSLRVVACLTDADIGRALSLHDAVRWAQLLGSTSLVAAAVHGCSPVGTLMVRGTRSARLDPPAGDHWLAVGDAASTFDPLSSQGIVKALRSGIFASYAIADCLERGAIDALEKYGEVCAREVGGYMEAKAKYYGMETRWAGQPFWSRRLVAARPSGEIASSA